MHWLEPKWAQRGSIVFPCLGYFPMHLICLDQVYCQAISLKQVYFVFVIDMRSFDCLIGWQAHVGEVCSMQFSADETTAYSMGTDGKVRNISVTHRTVVLVWIIHEFELR